MKQLRFEEKDKLADILKAVQDTPEEELEIIFVGSGLDQATLDNKVIATTAEKLGKKITFREKDLPTPSVPTNFAQDDHGFVEGRDVAEENKSALPTKPEETVPVAASAKKQNFISKLKILLKGPKWLYFLAAGVLFFVIGGGFAFWLLPSATVTIFTKAQFQEAEFPLKASESIENVDKEAGLVPLKILEDTVEDSIEVQTTGSTTVGTPAKGRVTIVNKDTNDKTFFKGAVLTTISGPKIEFTLDEVVNIAASPDGCGPPSPTPCEEVGADVTAKAIGEPGNLKSGTVFKVGDADLLAVSAANPTNFTGGTSKKITVVSANDQKKAKEDLLKKMQDTSRKDLETENPQIIIPEDGFQSEIVKEEYSHKVGEEATTLRLSMETKFSAKSFSRNDLQDILLSEITGNIPSDFVVDENNIFVTSEILDEKDGEYNIVGKIKAALLPNLKEDEVKSNIAGKDFGSADKYLKGLNSVSGFEVKIKPTPFKIFGILPMLKSKISLEIKPEE